MNPLNALTDYIEKARSHVYGIFIFWIGVLHLPVIFVSLFVDQNLIYEKTHQLKNEYVKSTFFNYSAWWEWALYVTAISGIAIFFTWLIIWVLPKPLIKRAYAKELEDQFERDFMKIDKENELEKKKRQLIDKQLETVKNEEEIVQKQEAIEQKGLKDWDKEIDRQQKSGLINAIATISSVIYEHGGHIDRYYDQEKRSWQEPGISKDELAFAHSSGLVDLNTEKKTISLTPKGLYFINRGYFDRLP